MRIVFLLLPAVVYLPAGVYLYHFFQRFFTLFHLRQKQWYTRLAALALTIVCVARGWRIYGVGAVVLLYFVASCLAVEAVRLAVVKTPARRLLASGGLRRWAQRIYCSGAVAALITALAMGYGWWNIHQVRRTEYTVETRKRLDREFTIVQISDLHMGTVMDEDALKNSCIRIQGEEPDLLVLTGDIFDERTSRQELEAAVRLLGGIRTTCGIYYVFGNHDYNRYSALPAYTDQELREELARQGIRVLEDQAADAAPGLTVIGRRDASVRRLETRLLIPPDREDSFLLLLDHQPRNLEENARAGIDLQLSGHTHAGQIWPTGQLGQLLGIIEHNYGLKEAGGCQVIVSSGIAGWGYPIRTGGHSEYVVVNIRPAADAR